MGKCKTKAIRTDLATFQANPKPYVTLAHLELWYIQNPDILTTLVYSETEAYLKFCQTSAMKSFAKIVSGYNYFHKL